MRGYKLLSSEDIERAKELRQKNPKIYTKPYLAQLFGVAETTIWENVFQTERRIRDRRQYFKYYQKRSICHPCKRCEICLTRELEKGLPPLNYKVGDMCVVCYLKQFNKEYMDLINTR